MKEPIPSSRDIARELARRYSTMTHEELDLLEGIIEMRKFKKGEMILREGEQARCINYIERGMTRQFYYKGDKELTEHIGVEKTIVYSIESLFREIPTKLQAQALENTVIFSLNVKKLEEIALHCANIQILFRKILEESLINSQRHADLVRFESALDRYKKYARMFPQVIQRAPLIYVASYLQMTPETLSRVRAQVLNEK